MGTAAAASIHRIGAEAVEKVDAVPMGGDADPQNCEGDASGDADHRPRVAPTTPCHGAYPAERAAAQSGTGRTAIVASTSR